MKGIKEILINVARAKGICSESYSTMLNATSVDALVNYYVANPDWCLERNFPSLDMLREHFPDAGKMGVFVDRTFHGEVLNDLQTYIFHNCKGTIKVGLNVDKAIIPMLYLANGCRLRIIGVGEVVSKDPSEVPIYVFVKNDYSAKDNKHVGFNIYKHELI